MNDELVTYSLAPSGRPPSYLRIILNNLKIWCRIKLYTRKFAEDQASEALVASTQEFAPCLDALVRYVAGMMLDACSCQRRFYDIITVFFDALNFLAKEKEEVRCETARKEVFSRTNPSGTKMATKLNLKLNRTHFSRTPKNPECLIARSQCTQLRGPLVRSHSTFDGISFLRGSFFSFHIKM